MDLVGDESPHRSRPSQMTTTMMKPNFHASPLAAYSKLPLSQRVRLLQDSAVVGSQVDGEGALGVLPFELH